MVLQRHFTTSAFRVNELAIGQRHAQDKHYLNGLFQFENF